VTARDSTPAVAEPPRTALMRGFTRIPGTSASSRVSGPRRRAWRAFRLGARWVGSCAKARRGTSCLQRVPPAGN